VNGRAIHERAESIADWLRGARIHNLGLFDTDALGDAIRRAGLGLGDAVAVDRIGQSLALAAWYEQWDRAPFDWVVESLPEASRPLRPSRPEPARCT
jgi:hypothetical protein